MLIVKLPDALIKEELADMERMNVDCIDSGRDKNWRPAGVVIDKIIPRRRTYKATV